MKVGDIFDKKEIELLRGICVMTQLGVGIVYNIFPYYSKTPGISNLSISSIKNGLPIEKSNEFDLTKDWYSFRKCEINDRLSVAGVFEI